MDVQVKKVKVKYSDIMKTLMKPIETPHQKIKEDNDKIKNNVGGGVFSKLNKI